MSLRPTLLAILVSLAPLPAGATVVKAMEIEDLAEAAELVVRGTATEHSAGWAARGRLIHTLTRIQVSENVKGDAQGDTVEVRTPGGTVGDITQRVTGSPQIAPGEEVVLFLKRLPGKRRFFEVVGFAQGKFSVVRDAGRELIVRDAPGLSLLESDGRLRRAARFGPVPVRQFVERVRKSRLEKRSP